MCYGKYIEATVLIIEFVNTVIAAVGVMFTGVSLLF